MVHYYTQLDRHVPLRVFGVLVVVWALFIAYTKLVLQSPLLPPIVGSGQTESEKGITSEEKNGRSGTGSSEIDMALLVSNTLSLPPMGTEFRTMMVQDPATHEWMSRLQPDLMGVPAIGTPLKATLARRIAPEEQLALAKLIQRNASPKDRHRVVVYVIHSSTGVQSGYTDAKGVQQEVDSSIVTAYLEDILPRNEWTAFCDPSTDNCTNMGVDLYASTQAVRRFN